MHNVPTTLAILAGGRGRRMGAAKDRVRIQGRPILLHILEQVRHTGPTLLVASPAHPRPAGGEAFDHIVLDAIEGAGPVAGIAAALSAALTPLVVVLSVDMPGVSKIQVDWLVHQMLSANPRPLGIMIKRGCGDDRSVEPFPAVYLREAAPTLATRLHSTDQGAEVSGGSLRSLLQVPRFVTSDEPGDWPLSTWTNLNAPDDLATFGGEIA